MTDPSEDLEGRLRRVLTTGAAALPAGRVVPPFDLFRNTAKVHKPRRISRKAAALGAAATLTLGGSAAAAAISHLGSASTPVTNSNLARCYSIDSLAGGNNFAGLSTTAAGPTGTQAKVTDAVAACTVSWADGFLTLGSTQVGGNRLPSGTLTPDHPVPPLTVCVLPDGTAGVFPGNESTCHELGLPAAQAK